MENIQNEPAVIITPCLSSAKRKLKVWIYEPLDLLLVAGIIIFGKEILSYKTILIIVFSYTIMLAFWKHGKPEGYLQHMVIYHLRPKTFKPNRKRAQSRFKKPISQEN